YLFQRDPELRRSVSPELAITPRAAAPVPREEQSAAPRVATPPVMADKAKKQAAVEGARGQLSYTQREMADERGASGAPAAPAGGEASPAPTKRGAPGPLRRGDLERLRKEDQPPQSAAPAAPSAAPAPTPPPQAQPEPRAKSRDALERP